MRKREVRRWLTYRYGNTVPNDDAGRDDLAIYLLYVAQSNPADPVGAAVKEAVASAPWLSQVQAWGMAKRAANKPVRFKADKLAKRLGVTNDLCTQLRFTTIGACDLTRPERIEARRKRHAEAKRNKRRASGMPPRHEWLEAHSVSRAKPWEAEGISRAQYYRRRKGTVRQVCPHRIRDEAGTPDQSR
jgi:hypothetical protein